jgi:plasmid stabilization system protein ParE
LSLRANEPHLLPAARQDIADALAWYEQQTRGLGREFLRCIDATTISIQRHPQMYPPVLDRYRRAVVRRFPYVIFYAVEPERIVIYAVFHCSQDPDKWKARLRN